MLRYITVFLVDDESDSREVLTHLLASYERIKIIGEAANITDAYEQIQQLKPDLVFLDIQMPKGDGFALLKKFEHIFFEIVFVTSFDEYAINAIKFSALDYLLKPVKLDDLEFCIKKATTNIDYKINTDEKIKSLLENTNSNQSSKKLSVHTKNGVKLINADDILYAEASGRYTIINMADGLSYTLAKNLIDLEIYLQATENFIRINKSQLLRLKCITGYSKGRTCIITLANGEVFEVSRRKKQEILNILKNSL